MKPGEHLGQNMNNGRYICYILRNVTNPEAIDSAIRLAETIRWFDGDSDLDPLLDLIVPLSGHTSTQPNTRT